jgi:hypothetical protein
LKLVAAMRSRYASAGRRASARSPAAGVEDRGKRDLEPPPLAEVGKHGADRRSLSFHAADGIEGGADVLLDPTHAAPVDDLHSEIAGFRSGVGFGEKQGDDAFSPECQSAQRRAHCAVDPTRHAHDRATTVQHLTDAVPNRSRDPGDLGVNVEIQGVRSQRQRHALALDLA